MQKGSLLNKQKEKICRNHKENVGKVIMKSKIPQIKLLGKQQILKPVLQYRTKHLIHKTKQTWITGINVFIIHKVHYLKRTYIAHIAPYLYKFITKCIEKKFRKTAPKR